MLEIPDMLDFKPKAGDSLKPHIENEEELKKAFGMQLAAGKQPFEAALTVTNSNTNISLWICQRWINDPIVIASKDLSLKSVYNPEELLDAEELAANLLRMANEKDKTNTFYLLEGKDRIATLKLYAEVRGLIGKQAVDQSTKNFTYNKMVVKFVSPEKKEEIVDNSNDVQLPNNNKSPLKLKLVS